MSEDNESAFKYKAPLPSSPPPSSQPYCSLVKLPTYKAHTSSGKSNRPLLIEKEKTLIQGTIFLIRQKYPSQLSYSFELNNGQFCEFHHHFPFISMTPTPNLYL